MLRSIACSIIWFFASFASEAGVLDVIDAQRSKSCNGVAGPGTSFRLVQELNAAATLLPGGMRGPKAVAQTGYRGTHARVIYLDNYFSDRWAAEFIARHFCDSVNNPAFEDVGVFRRGNEAWIILATPYPLPTLDQAPALREDILTNVNRARAQTRYCGSVHFEAAPPVEYSVLLQEAAFVHSVDMAGHDRVSHEGSEGDRAGDRVALSGYTWKVVGENLAAGQNRAEQLVAGWIASPGHCANIMNPRFIHMGVAFATNGESKLGIYWTQVFAAPEPPPTPQRRTRN